MTEAAVEVGPALFFSLLIITLSFIPVFTLEAQEGRLFGPLALTKTYAMAAAAGLSVTLVPILMGYWIRGKIPEETRNPLNRGLIHLYRPLLDRVLNRPILTIVVAGLALLSTAWPLSHLGGEFMPPLEEGDLLYMPSALPGLSAEKASELLQLTDRMIKTVPEVATVFGKAGRAETATDPAPLEMFETTIQFKPRDQWRPGMTAEKLIELLDQTVKVPGLATVWIPLIMGTLPFALTGGVWFLYLQGYNLSIATGVGFIALAGVAAEFGVVMLLYLKQAAAQRQEEGLDLEPEVLEEALRHGAVLRVRPKAMTVAVIVAGLLPIFWGHGAGSEVMSRIAAPMVGGMITAPLPPGITATQPSRFMNSTTPSFWSPPEAAIDRPKGKFAEQPSPLYTSSYTDVRRALKYLSLTKGYLMPQRTPCVPMWSETSSSG
jgi:Cu/Ag efflux pump CusA